MEIEENETSPKIGMNLYLQTFCCFCHKVLKIGEMVVKMTEDKASCRSCGLKITENWFSDKKGRSDG